MCGGPPLFGCSRLLIQYIRSYPPYLEAVSYISTASITNNIFVLTVIKSFLQAKNSCLYFRIKLVVFLRTYREKIHERPVLNPFSSRRVLSFHHIDYILHHLHAVFMSKHFTVYFGTQTN
jgi:hypothetical protein